MNYKTYAQVASQVVSADIVKAVHEAVTDGLKKRRIDNKADVSVMVFGLREPNKDMSNVSKLLEDSIHSIMNIQRIGKYITSNIQRIGKYITSNIQRIGKYITSNIQRIGKYITSNIQRIGKYITSNIQRIGKYITSNIQRIGKYITSNIQRIGKYITSNIQRIGKYIISNIQRIGKYITSNIQRIGKYITSNIQRIGKYITSNIQRIGKYITSNIQRIGKYITSNIQRIGKYITSNIQRIGKYITSNIQRIGKYITSNIQRIGKYITSNIQRIGKYITSNIQRIGKYITSNVPIDYEKTIKIRPLRVELRCKEDKDGVLRNTRELVRAYRQPNVGLRIAKYLNTDESAKIKLLCNKCGELNNKNPALPNGKMQFVVIDGRIMKRLKIGELMLHKPDSSSDQKTDYMKSSCNLPSGKSILSSISQPSGCAITNGTFTTVCSGQASIVSQPMQAPTSSVSPQVLSP